MTGTQTTHILVGIEALRERASDFETIFQIIAAPATGRWPGLLIWMETHPNYEPWGVIIERDEKLVGAAVLTRYRRLGIWRIGKPGGACDTVRFAALDEDAALALGQAISCAVRDFGGPWAVEITDLPCPTELVISHLTAHWPHSQIQQAPPVPCLHFSPNTSLNKYLSRNTRAAVAKARNRIQRENVQMVQQWTRDPERIRALMSQVEDVYRLRDHQLRQKSLIDAPASKGFFEAFVTEHARQGLIDLLTIHLNGELAAFALCLLDNGLHWVLVNRASPAWLRYSPGTIANAEVVRHAFEMPDCHGVNWGGEPQRYKLSGQVTLWPRQTLCAWSSSTTRLIIELLKLLRRIKHVLSRPWLALNTPLFSIIG